MQIGKKAFFTLLFHFWLFNSAFYGYLRAIEAATNMMPTKKKKRTQNSLKVDFNVMA